MISATDIPRLKWPIGAVVLALLLVGAILWYMDQQRQVALRGLGSAQRSYRDAHARYIDAQRDEDLLWRVVNRYAGLQARGVVGPEARLDWVERVREARAQAGLPQLDFELRPRRPLTAGGTVPVMTASTMSVSSEMAHEGRLLEFLDLLRAEPTALTRVRRCRIDRRAQPDTAATLDFECEIDWITIQTAERPAP